MSEGTLGIGLIMLIVLSGMTLVWVVFVRCAARSGGQTGVKQPTKKERARQAARAARIKLEAATRPDDDTNTTTFISHHKKGAGETAATLAMPRASAARFRRRLSENS